MPSCGRALLALLAVAAACGVAAAAAERESSQLDKKQPPSQEKKRPAGDPGFDLFLLVRSYSPTFCTQVHCTIRPM